VPPQLAAALGAIAPVLGGLLGARRIETPEIPAELRAYYAALAERERIARPLYAEAVAEMRELLGRPAGLTAEEILRLYERQREQALAAQREQLGALRELYGMRFPGALPPPLEVSLAGMLGAETQRALAEAYRDILLRGEQLRRAEELERLGLARALAATPREAAVLAAQIGRLGMMGELARLEQQRLLAQQWGRALGGLAEMLMRPRPARREATPVISPLIQRTIGFPEYQPLTLLPAGYQPIGLTLAPGYGILR